MDQGEKTVFAEIFKIPIPVCSQYMGTSIKASPVGALGNFLPWKPTLTVFPVFSATFEMTPQKQRNMDLLHPP